MRLPLFMLLQVLFTPKKHPIRHSNSLVTSPPHHIFGWSKYEIVPWRPYLSKSFDKNGKNVTKLHIKKEGLATTIWTFSCINPHTLIMVTEIILDEKIHYITLLHFLIQCINIKSSVKAKFTSSLSWLTLMLNNSCITSL